MRSRPCSAGSPTSCGTHQGQCRWPVRRWRRRPFRWRGSFGGPTGSGPLAALNWARTQVGKPYIWGGVGPAGFDCSGFMSALVNIIRGRSPYSRLGNTASMPWSGFAPGLFGSFQLGNSRNTGGGIGHTAGTLLGVNVESAGGVGVRMGAAARGATSGIFNERREFYGKTQTEVRAKLREARERLEAGAPMRDAAVTVAAWLEDWTTKALPASDRKQATIDLYATIASNHLAPKLGNITLERLRPSDVEALILAKRRAGLSASTVRTIYTVLRSALDVAVRDGLIRRNPAAAVKRPQVERQEAAYLSADQAHALLEVLRGDRLEALYRVMLATGLRRGEALALHWRDVDLDDAALRVRWTLSRTSTGLELGEPKTEKSRRTVPLPRSAVEALREHRKRQAAEQLAAGHLWQRTGLVFTTEIGTPLEPATSCAGSRRKREAADRLDEAIQW